MNWTGPAIVLSARHHGEGAAVAQVFARDHGRYAGLVHARKTKGSLLQPGSRVMASWRARIAENLGVFQLESEQNAFASTLEDRGALMCLSAMCALTESALPERDPHATTFDAMTLVLDALSRRELWPALYVRWEIGLLADLGFGLALDICAMTGTRENLCFVSPKTGRAASEQAGAPYAHLLLPLPKFLHTGEIGNGPSWSDIADGLRLTGHFLETRVFAAHNAPLPNARTRLAEEIARLARTESDI